MKNIKFSLAIFSCLLIAPLFSSIALAKGNPANIAVQISVVGKFAHPIGGEFSQVNVDAARPHSVRQSTAKVNLKEGANTTKTFAYSNNHKFYFISYISNTGITETDSCKSLGFYSSRGNNPYPQGGTVLTSKFTDAQDLHIKFTHNLTTGELFCTRS